MLLFTIIKLLPTLQLSRQKTNFFSNHFESILPCPACLGGLAFKAIKRKKKCYSEWQSAWSRVQKTRYVSAISDVSGSIANVNVLAVISDKYTTF